MMFEGTQGAGDLGRVDAAGSSSGGGSGGVVLRIGGTVTLAYQPSSGGGAANSHGSAVLEWVSGSDADMVADAVVAVVLQAAGAPPGMEGAEAARRKALAAGDTGGVEAAELSILTALLGAQFGPARVDEDQVGGGCGSGWVGGWVGGGAAAAAVPALRRLPSLTGSLHPCVHADVRAMPLHCRPRAAPRDQPTTITTITTTRPPAGPDLCGG